MKEVVGLIVVCAFLSVNISAQIVSNGGFTSGTAGWYFHAQGGASATGTVSGGVFHANISKGGTEAWHVQLLQGNVLIQKDSTYLVKFEAYADAERSIQAGVGMNQDPWSGYGGTEVLLDTVIQEYEFTFKMNSTTNSNSRVVFDLGGSSTNVHIDNVSVSFAPPVEYKGMKPTPFTKGVNLTNWFQADSPYQIDFTKYTKEDFENIKSLGADVIRLPINLHSMVGPAPDYALDSLFTFFLDQVVDWAEELELHLILDNHTFDPSVDTSPDIGDILIPVWTNMAEHYKDRSEYVYYEVLNEPHGISEALWNSIQLDVVEAIRTVDTKHTIVVGPANFNSYSTLSQMPEYPDTNLIYTYHFYDPFLLTHQGASWTDPSLVSLSGIPFPYDASKMPTVPNDLQGTWVESSFPSYAEQGTAEHVQNLLGVAIEFAEIRGVAIFCGEMGVYSNNSDNESRVNWHTIVNAYLTEQGVAWTNWDYHGGFGIFEPGSNGLFDHDLNVPIIEAMGFNVPPQTEYVIKPDSTDFFIYDDYTAKGVSGSGSGETLNFYDKSDPVKGQFNIKWAGANQYQAITFDFQPNKDLSVMIEREYYAVIMWVKADNPETSFDLRFHDTKTGPEDHPWRMFYRVDNSVVDFDGKWHYLIVPLNEFTEMGSWDNGEWHTPEGLFDWSAIDNLNIVAEAGAHENAQFWFDEISIGGYVLPSTENMDGLPDEFHLDQNYPNPFNPNTVIRYQLPVNSTVDLKVFDMLGREVAVLVDQQQAAGNHSVTFNASGLASGMYFYELRAGELTQIRKMMLLK